MEFPNLYGFVFDSKLKETQLALKRITTLTVMFS